MNKSVYLLTRDLLFRGKLGAVISRADGAAKSEAAGCALAVVDLAAPEWEARVRDLRTRGVAVLAFGSHVNVEALRRARALGAEAVPNSQVERRLAELLAS